MALKSAFVSTIATATVVAAGGLIKEDTATKTLVLVDDWSTIETHSILFDHLKSTLGHVIEFDMPTVFTQRIKGVDALSS